MIGSLKRQGKRSWRYIYDLPREKGISRRQKAITIRGTREDAEAEAIKIQHMLRHGIPEDPGEMTVGALLLHWLGAVESTVRAKTFERYGEVVHLHLIPDLGDIQLSKLRPIAIQACYAKSLGKTRADGTTKRWNPRTIRHHHRILRQALGQAGTVGADRRESGGCRDAAEAAFDKNSNLVRGRFRAALG